MNVKLSDIAREVGVSEATVSLALNNRAGVREQTRQMVQDAARRMGYLPNVMAKSLACQKSPFIGIVVTDMANAYFGELSKRCEMSIRERNYNPLIASSMDQYHLEEMVVDQFVAQRVAGIIIVPPDRYRTNIGYLNRLERFGIKYVFATSYYSSCDVPYVMTDLEKGTYQSVKYLLDLGHRRIAFLGTDPAMIPTMLRADGYRRAFSERDAQADPDMLIYCSGADFASGYEATMNLMQSGTHVDAIVTINDLLALGSLRALLECGVSVPGDISLIGYDDIIYAQVATIPLTTVHQDVDMIARRAVSMLTYMIDHDVQTRDHVMIEPRLIVRGSTGICPR